MPESGDVIRGYLQEAIAAEASVQKQFQAFAEQGDDDEVRAVFSQQAYESHSHGERLAARLEELGSTSSFRFKSALLDISSSMAKLNNLQRPEEQTAHNLMSGFAVATSQCAMYEALAAVAESAGDTATSSLIREIQAQVRRAAEQIWHFLPSRLKIAFNMLTAGEIDPSVETRATVDRIV
jgi:ferritin-like metal-binding protein YciE